MHGLDDGLGRKMVAKLAGTKRLTVGYDQGMVRAETLHMEDGIERHKSD